MCLLIKNSQNYIKKLRFYKNTSFKEEIDINVLAHNYNNELSYYALSSICILKGMYIESIYFAEKSRERKNISNATNKGDAQCGEPPYSFPITNIITQAMR